MLSYHATCSKVEVDRLKVTFQDTTLGFDAFEDAVHAKPRLSWLLLLTGRFQYLRCLVELSSVL